MPLRYQEVSRFVNGHSEGVTCLAFSPRGSFLASGGLDGRVCIWSLKTSSLLHSLSGTSPVLSIAWISAQEQSIFCGLKDGNVAFIKLSSAVLSLTGFWAHNYPVERLAVHPRQYDRLASGAHKEVRIWSQRGSGQRIMEAELEEPPRNSLNRSAEVLVTSLHWMADDDPPALMVSYMFHGIVIVEGQTWTRTRIIPQYGCVADATLSHDSRFFAVSNLVTGFDVYRIDSEEPVSSLRHTVGEPLPTPVRFVHGGQAVLTGSTVGDVRLWATNSGRPHQSLFAGKKRRVLAIDAYHELHAKDPDSDIFLIATGTTNTKGSGTITLWKARKLDYSDMYSRSSARRAQTVNTWLLILIGIFIVAWIAGAPGIPRGLSS